MSGRCKIAGLERSGRSRFNNWWISLRNFLVTVFFFFLFSFLSQSVSVRKKWTPRACKLQKRIGRIEKACSYDMEIMTQSDYRRFAISPNMGLQRTNLIPNTDSCAYVSISVLRVIERWIFSNSFSRRNVISFFPFSLSRYSKINNSVVTSTKNWTHEKKKKENITKNIKTYISLLSRHYL